MWLECLDKEDKLDKEVHQVLKAFKVSSRKALTRLTAC